MSFITSFVCTCLQSTVQINTVPRSLNALPIRDLETGLVSTVIIIFIYLFIYFVGLVVILRKSLYLVSQLVDLVLRCCFCPRWPAVCTRTLSCRVELQWLWQHCWKKMKLNYEQGKALKTLSNTARLRI